MGEIINFPLNAPPARFDEVEVQVGDTLFSGLLADLGTIVIEGDSIFERPRRLRRHRLVLPTDAFASGTQLCGDLPPWLRGRRLRGVLDVADLSSGAIRFTGRSNSRGYWAVGTGVWTPHGHQGVA